MTTWREDPTVEPAPAMRAWSPRLWWPRTWGAFGVWLLLAAVMAHPLLIALIGTVFFFTGCIFDCTDPDRSQAMVMAAWGLAFAAVPFAGVRFYQGTRPATVAARLGVLVVVVMAGVFVGWKIGYAWSPE